MTVAELIKELAKVPPNAKVEYWNLDSMEYVEVSRVETGTDGQVLLV